MLLYCTQLGLSRESRHSWWYIEYVCELFRWRSHKDSATLLSCHFRLILCSNPRVRNMNQIISDIADV